MQSSGRAGAERPARERARRQTGWGWVHSLGTVCDGGLARLMQTAPLHRGAMEWAGMPRCFAGPARRRHAAAGKDYTARREVDAALCKVYAAVRKYYPAVRKDYAVTRKYYPAVCKYYPSVRKDYAALRKHHPTVPKGYAAMRKA